MFDSSDDRWFAIQLVENAPEVAVHFCAQSRVSQEWPPLLSGEDRVDQDLGQRLRHSGSMRCSQSGCNPFRVEG